MPSIAETGLSHWSPTAVSPAFSITSTIASPALAVAQPAPRSVFMNISETGASDILTPTFNPGTLVPAYLRDPEAKWPADRFSIPIPRGAVAPAATPVDTPAPAPVAAPDIALGGKEEAAQQAYYAALMAEVFVALTTALARKDFPVAAAEAETLEALQKNWHKAPQKLSLVAGFLRQAVSGYIKGMPDDLFKEFAQIIGSLENEGTDLAEAREQVASIAKVVASKLKVSEGASVKGEPVEAPEKPTMTVEQIRAATKETEEVALDSVTRSKIVELNDTLSVEVVKNAIMGTSSAQVNLYVYAANNQDLNKALASFNMIYRGMVVLPSWFTISSKETPVRFTLRVDFVPGLTKVDDKNRATIEFFNDGKLVKFLVPTERHGMGFSQSS